MTTYEFHLSNGSDSTTFTWDGTDANWPKPSGTGNLTVGGNTATWQTQDYASGYGASPGQFNPGIIGVANYGPYDIRQSESLDSTYHIVFTNNIWSITQSGFTWKVTQITGPTVTTARTSHSGIIPNATNFTIRDPNPGTWYEKTGAGKFKIKFYDQNEPSGGYNITINWTKMDDSSGSHTETISAAAGDYSIEIDTSSAGGVKHNSNITITFNQNSYYSGTWYTAGNVLNTFTFLASGPFSGSFSPSGGKIQNNPTITVSIQDDNPYPEQSRVVSYEKPDGTKTNVTLNSTNEYQFTTTFSSSVGTAKIYDTDKDNATASDIIATATYNDKTYNGANGMDGYPIIMTNLFNRNRSIYSIGMTHKTASDPFI